MTRGKYSNATEARRTRESALSEVEAGRKAIVRLTAENRELRETIAEMTQHQNEERQRLRGLIEAGTSEEAAALRVQIRSIRERAAEERKARAIAAWKVLNQSGVRLPPLTWEHLARALGVDAGLLLDGLGIARSRSGRRAGNTKLTQIQEMRNAKRPAPGV